MPIKIIGYLSKDFLFCLLIIFLIFFSLISLINFVEELIFFKEKDKSNLFYIVSLLTILKTPSNLINFSPFIFLFTGIFFFIKLRRSNEMTPINLAGLSKIFILTVPAIWSFIIGIILILLLSPLSSFALKNYETIKRIDSNNDNLIIVNKTGLWFMEKNPNNIDIIRAEKVLDKNFSNLLNVSIYLFNNEFLLKKRIEAKNLEIKKDNWIAKNVKVYEKLSVKEFSNYTYQSKINLELLKFFFSNPDTLSIWNINDEIKLINQRGYSADEFVIKYHKYLSLPFFLLSMIVLSTLFTINIKTNFNNFIYIFFGVFLGIVIYFLSDLSIALGKNQYIPLILSVWLPIILISIFSLINLTSIQNK